MQIGHSRFAVTNARLGSGRDFYAAPRQAGPGQEQPLQTDNDTDKPNGPLLVPDQFYRSQTPVTYL